MQRNIVFDTARCAAIVVIVTCHYLLFGGIEGLGEIGRYLAGTGNFIFFAISALLFGLRYEQKGAMAFEAKTFMKKRMVRLFASLWPFLATIVIVYSCMGVEFGTVEVVMNFMGLGWFAKLPNIGHLWFVTMIIFCYILYVCVSHMKLIERLNGGGIWTFVLICSMLLEVLADSVGQPGYFFMVTFYSL